MRETISPQLSHLTPVVTSALKAYRDGDLLALADSPLVDTPLVESGYLAGEPLTADTRARSVQSLLRWGIDKLRAGGAQDWLDPLWRHHNLLNAFYIERKRVADIAELLAIADQTFYEWRQTAIASLVHIFLQEWRSSEDTAGRERRAILDRYGAVSPEEQQFLRALAIFSAEAPHTPHPIPPQWLQTLTHQPITRGIIQQLSEQSLIQLHGRDIALHPAAAPHINTLITLDEWDAWQRAAARLQLSADHPVSAMTHLLAMGDTLAAAKLALEHEHTLLADTSLATVADLLGRIPLADLQRTPDVLARFNMLLAHVAEQREDLPTALNAYAAVLAAPDLHTRANAWYQRARLLMRHNLDESLSHYAVCIDMLERIHAESALDDDLLQLLTRMMIDRAWLFLQERPDEAAADRDLARAEQLIPAEDAMLWSDLYNARAGLAKLRADQPAAIAAFQRAWSAATASQDKSRMMRTAYNLGDEYVWAKQVEDGLRYLEIGRGLAEEMGNLQMLGVANKGIGTAYFFQSDYAKAIAHYEQAYQTWDAMDNPNWLANSCYDLAEAHAVSGSYDDARRYFDQGRALAQTLGHDRYLAEFADLATQFPNLQLELNERQQKAIAYVHEHGAMTRQQYVTLSDVSKSQAYRDLEELCDLNLLERVGKGRGTRYQIPA